MTKPKYNVDGWGRELPAPISVKGNVFCIEVRNPQGEDVGRVRCSFDHAKTLTETHAVDGEAEVIALTLEAVKKILIKCAGSIRT